MNLYACECVIIQFVLVLYYTASLRVLFCCFLFLPSGCTRRYFFSAKCPRQSVYVTPHTVVALWVTFYDLLCLSDKKTISMSAVALAGVCVTNVTGGHTHFRRHALNSKTEAVLLGY